MKDCLQVVDIPGKGKGLIATRTIQAGELICVEEPLLSIDLSSPETGPAVQASFDKLTSQDKAALLDLSSNRPKTENRLVGIFRTNAWPLGFNEGTFDEEEGAIEGAVFVVGSRFNHDCTPNVTRSWNPKERKMEWRSIFSICKDEELTIEYYHAIQPRGQLQSVLSVEHSFRCCCKACSLTGKALKESNDRRARIAAAFDWDALLQLAASNPLCALIKIKQGMKDAEAESLMLIEGELAYHAYRICALYADFKEAKAWVKLAVKYSIMKSGEQGVQTQWLREYFEKPNSFLQAGLLGKKKLIGPDV